MSILYQKCFSTPEQPYNTSKKRALRIRYEIFRERVQTYLELVTYNTRAVHEYFFTSVYRKIWFWFTVLRSHNI